MPLLAQHWVLGVFVVVQLAGLMAAWFARASQGSSGHEICQRLLFVALAIVSASAIGSILFSPGIWLVPGVTLSLMIVGTTCDFRPAERAGGGIGVGRVRPVSR